jgi:hypothetical protein
MSGARKDPPPRAGLSGVPMVVAVGAVLIWLAFVIVLLTRSDAESEQWTRLTFVFASVQALAFAGAGALFGVTVQSARVEKAERAAEENAEDAANGRALAAYTIADEEAGEEGELESLPGAGSAATVRRRHAEVARRLFPGAE